VSQPNDSAIQVMRKLRQAGEQIPVKYVIGLRNPKHSKISRRVRPKKNSPNPLKKKLPNDL
jgi:hypothetical protein